MPPAPRTLSLQRHAAAVLSGDIAGFSRLVADDVTATIESIERAKDATAQAVADVGGTLVDFVGDSFLAVFPATVSAVTASRRIAAALRVHNEAAPASRHVLFRMGVSVGELITDGTSYFGEAVNVAARIREVVEPGGIALSGDALARLDSPDEKVEPAGRHHFRNIPEPVHVYRLDDGEPGRVRNQAARAGVRPCVTFHGVSVAAVDDTVLERSARVLTHEIRSGLLSIPSLLVLNGDAVGDVPPPSHLLEVWCDRSGNDGRVYFELIDATRWVPAWADRYTFAADSLAAHVDSIVADVVSAVDVHAVLGEYGRIYRTSLRPESVHLVHRALKHLLIGTPDDLTEARRLYEEVAVREPGRPEAYGLIAFVVMMQILGGHSTDIAADVAFTRRCVARAHDAGDDTGLADMVLAQILAWEGRFDDAFHTADGAIAIRTSCDVTYAVKASVLRYMGRWEEAVEMARQAIDLTPVAPVWYPTVLASAYFVGGRYEYVIDTVEPLAAAGVADGEGLLLLAASQRALGMQRSAVATMNEFSLRFPRLEPVETVRRHHFVEEAVSGRWLGLLDSIALDSMT